MTQSTVCSCSTSEQHAPPAAGSAETHAPRRKIGDLTVNPPGRQTTGETIQLELANLASSAFVLANFLGNEDGSEGADAAWALQRSLQRVADDLDRLLAMKVIHV